MKKDRVLTKEEFDRFIDWLDEDRNQAGAKYEVIRRRLSLFFNCRGCGDPEFLADETINRVVGKLPSFTNSYTGDKNKIFYGFAKFVHLEYLKESETHDGLLIDFIRRINQSEADAEQEHIYHCLGSCLRKLPAHKQKIFITYYLVESKEKVSHHQKLAEEFEMTINALRKQVFDLKKKLADCIKRCLKK